MYQYCGDKYRTEAGTGQKSETLTVRTTCKALSSNEDRGQWSAALDVHEQIGIDYRSNTCSERG